MYEKFTKAYEGITRDYEGLHMFTRAYAAKFKSTTSLMPQKRSHSKGKGATD